MDAYREPGDRDGHCARKGHERAPGPRWIRMPDPARRRLKQGAGAERSRAERDPAGEPGRAARASEHPLTTSLQRKKPFV
jgi:hypothetical protein